MTFQVVVESEGCLLPDFTLGLRQTRDGQLVRVGGVGCDYVDPQRVRDENLTQLLDGRDQAQTEFFFQSERILLIPEGEDNTDEIRHARDRGWYTWEVLPGDTLRISGQGNVVILGVEPAQPELYLVDARTEEVVPLEEMRYGVSYYLELVLSERHKSSTLFYEVVWGEGRFQNADVLMTRVVSEAEPAGGAGYSHFRSDEPMVFDDASLPAHPRSPR